MGCEDEDCWRRPPWPCSGAATSAGRSGATFR